MFKQLARISYRHRRLMVAGWLVLVPATMELLGDKNWWIPRWLDRILPAIHVGATPEEMGAMRGHPERAGATTS